MESSNKKDQEPNKKTYIPLEEPLHTQDPISEQNSITIQISDNEKQKNSSSASFVIYIKFMDNSQKEIDIGCIMDQKISELHKLAFPDSFTDETKSIRLIYQGRLLNIDEKISGANFQKGGFIHGVISEKIDLNNTSQSTQISQQPAVEPGNREAIDLAINNIAIQMANFLIQSQNIRQNDQIINVNNPQNVVNVPNRMIRFNENSGWLFILGLVFGFCFNLWAVMIMCLCNFPDRARSGITFGFCLHMLVKIMSNWFE